MDTVTQMLRAPAHDERPAPELALGFDAPLANRALHLRLAGTARHAADAALALDELEPLLAALDDWCGTALDWRWAPQSAVQDTDAQVALRHGKAWVQLLCTWAWLRTRPAPPPPLADRLHWPPVPVVVQAGRLRLGADERLLLEPGGAVLLPDSMRSPWTGALRAIDEAPDAGIALEYSSPSWARLLPRRAVPAAAGPGDWLCEVRLQAPAALAGDLLTGWREADLDLGAFGGRASLWRCASQAGPALCLASGSLLPWGDGWALHLETVGT